MGSDSYDAHSRKMMSTQAIYTMTDRHSATQALRVRELQRLMQEYEQGKSQPQKKDGPPPTAVVWNGQTFQLDGDLIRIGRAEQNEITIDAKGVSRFHCQIRREDGKFIIEDLSSTNGTLVDGQLLREPYTLSTGDEVMICNEKLVFSSMPTDHEELDD
jgi:hypothetical protein